MSVRGAGVKAIGPRQRGKARAERLDAREHAQTVLCPTMPLVTTLPRKRRKPRPQAGRRTGGFYRNIGPARPMFRLVGRQG